MSYLKDQSFPVMIDGEEYRIAYNMTAVDAVLEKYDSTPEFIDAMKSDDRRTRMDCINWILSVMVNCCIEDRNEALAPDEEPQPLFTARSIARHLTIRDYGAIVRAVNQAVRAGTPTQAVSKEDPGKNG